MREKILAADNSDFLSQSEDFYILGVQVADVLPKVTADDLWDMMHGVGADQMYNPRFVAFFLGFTGQEFAAISDPNAIAKIRVHLENEDQWIMAAG
ncbi:hypothetical protein J2T09_000913 [Neorhizobium huautlense]|uniref:Uncharacterized protein n=1 Tax=Neorhizobium huautlense TaxID=67774 RepID=A0ABT9PNY4_9HYPH|nr:hypothetical protein [Neorhizobium huautlense]MDP9836171.1 hypothetical protein [Neorhizobium huautlense]